MAFVWSLVTCLSFQVHLRQFLLICGIVAAWQYWARLSQSHLLLSAHYLLPSTFSSSSTASVGVSSHFLFNLSICGGVWLNCYKQVAGGGCRVPLWAHCSYGSRVLIMDSCLQPSKLDLTGEGTVISWCLCFDIKYLITVAPREPASCRLCQPT